MTGLRITCHNCQTILDLRPRDLVLAVQPDNRSKDDLEGIATLHTHAAAVKNLGGEVGGDSPSDGGGVGLSALIARENAPLEQAVGRNPSYRWTDLKAARGERFLAQRAQAGSQSPSWRMGSPTSVTCGTSPAALTAAE
jgi:hypothetical protein